MFALDGDELRTGVRVQAEGHVDRGFSLNPEADRRYQIKQTPYGIHIVRAGMVVAVCDQPREELLDHAGQRVTVRGIMRCELDGQPCSLDESGRPVGPSGYTDHAMIPIIDSCQWEQAPRALPREYRDALVAQGVVADGGSIALDQTIHASGVLQATSALCPRSESLHRPLPIRPRAPVASLD